MRRAVLQFIRFLDFWVCVSFDQSGFSIWSLFLQADFVVKLVMFILIVSSILSWSIIWDKARTMAPLWREARQSYLNFLEEGGGAQDISERGVFGGMIALAKSEKRGLVQCEKALWPMRVKRLENLLSSLCGQVYRDLSRYMNILASIGSSAVFVGLFGTVWGIMNSFRSIASSQNTSLSVVAPGISEALFVTAVGLLVAIPAMVAYNHMMDSINRFMENAEDFSQELLAWLVNE